MIFKCIECNSEDFYIEDVFYICKFCGFENYFSNHNNNLKTISLDENLKTIKTSSINSSSSSLEDDFFLFQTNKNFEKYVKNLSKDIKVKLILMITPILKTFNIRGEETTKAIFAASYYYFSLESKIIVTSKDVYRWFSIDKRRFNWGKKMYLNYYGQYRIFKLLPIDYSNYVIEKYKTCFGIDNLDMNVEELFLKNIDIVSNHFTNVKTNSIFSSFNPLNICVCLFIFTVNNLQKSKKNKFINQFNMEKKCI